MNNNQNLAAYLLVLLVFCTVNTYAQQTKKTGYLINGTIKGVDSGMVRMFSNEDNYVLDSAFIVKGKFTMQGKIGTPERKRFNISPGNWNFQAFVMNTTLKYVIDTTGAEHFNSGGEQLALIWAIDESGSELSNVYTKYLKETGFRYYIPIVSSLKVKLRAVKGDEAASSKLKQEKDSIGNLIIARQKIWIDNFISKHPSSEAGVFLFYDLYKTYPDGTVTPSYLDVTLSRFSGPARSSSYYKKLADIASKLKQLQPNSLAPDFTLLKQDKSSFTLSSTRGNYTLIDFWASWCVPCRKAIPAWKEVYAKYKDKGLIMVSVSNDRDWADWIKALNKEQMPWIQVIDEFPDPNKPAVVSELYPNSSMPYYVFLDKEGKVIIASDDEEEVRKKIEEVLQ